jgi:hypothetical protein
MIDTVNDLTTVVGFAASIIAVLLGCIYLMAILTSFIKSGLTFPPSQPVQFVGAIVSMGTAIDLVILIVTIQRHIAESRQFLAEVAIIFTALLCVTTSINRFVQLSVFSQYNLSENPEIFHLLHPYGSKSIMFAIESLGWGLFYGLGMLFAGLALVDDGIELWISLLLIISGVLSLLFAVGVIIRHPILSLLGFPAWGILLPGASILLAIWFGRKL